MDPWPWGYSTKNLKIRIILTFSHFHEKKILTYLMEMRESWDNPNFRILSGMVVTGPNSLHILTLILS